MKPRIYLPTEKNFSHNGLGIMSDATRCDVTEEANGRYEVEIEHPLDSRFREYFENGYQIKAKPNDIDEYMIFEIKNTYQDTNGNNILIWGSSRTQKLGNREVQTVEIKSQNGMSAMRSITEGMDSPSDIELFSDIETVSSTLFEARNVLNCIAGEQGSLLQFWGGEMKHEPFKLSLLKRRGRDNVGTIRYGKDLTGLKIKLDWTSIITRVLPYADLQNGDDGQTKRIYGKAVDSNLIKNYPDVYAYHIQFTEEQGVKDEASLNRVAKNYFKSINPDSDKPKCSIEIEFEKLSDSEEAKEISRLRNYNLFDTFNVRHKLYNISLTSKITSIVYDSLTEKTKKMSAGDSRMSFYTKQNYDLQETIKTLTKKGYMSEFVDYITGLINGVEGGSILQYPKNKPHTVYYMDTDSVETAKDVIAINHKGLGFSQGKGWKGPFKNGWSIDGILNADFIKAGILNGVRIQAEDEKFLIDMFKGLISFKDLENDKKLGIIGATRGGTGLINGFAIIQDNDSIFSINSKRKENSNSRPVFQIPKESTGEDRLWKLFGTGSIEGDVKSTGRLDVKELYVDGVKIDQNGGGAGGGSGGGNLGSREDYAKNMITDLFSADYEKVYASYLKFPRIQAWGIANRTAFNELNEIIRREGVSPVFFWAYEGGEGYHASLSFLNHFYTNGSSYQEEARRTARWVKETSMTSGNLAWYDAQYPYYTSPPDKQAIGNAYMADTKPGMIARVMLQGTAAATWAMFDPAALSGSVNGVQDYADPFAHQMSLIKSWQSEMRYIKPMSQYAVMSEFGWRDSPLNPGVMEFHNAIDLASNGGRGQIFASNDGVVTFASGNYWDWYGNFVEIQHSDGLRTGYAHLSQINVSVGQKVSRGQLIGIEGATGPVTGPHLHFMFSSKPILQSSNSDFKNPRAYVEL